MEHIMSHEPGEQQSEPQEKKPHNYNTVLAWIGVTLLILSLVAWGAAISSSFSVRSTPFSAIVPSYPSLSIPCSTCIPQQLRPPCFTATPQSPLTFTVVQGQTIPTTETVTLKLDLQHCSFLPSRDTWSGNAVAYQGTHWLSISSTYGFLSTNAQSASVTVVVSSTTLSEGVYTGLLTFTSSDRESSELPVALDVVKDQQNASLGDLVTYTRISDLMIIAKWPRLTVGQSTNVTISLLSSKNLPNNLPSVASVAPLVATSIVSTGNNTQVTKSSDWLLENAYGSHLTSLVAQMFGTAFDISPSSPPQDPNQRIVSFHWNILPKVGGPQDLEVDIAGHWDNQSTTAYFLYSGFSVNVDSSPVPFFSLGQFSLGALLLSLLGSLLNVPWILDYIQKRKEQKLE
jgi:hypothetical protein